MEVWFVFYKFKSNLTSFVTKKRPRRDKNRQKTAYASENNKKQSQCENNESITFL